MKCLPFMQLRMCMRNSTMSMLNKVKMCYAVVEISPCTTAELKISK